MYGCEDRRTPLSLLEWVEEAGKVVDLAGRALDRFDGSLNDGSEAKLRVSGGDTSRFFNVF